MALQRAVFGSALDPARLTHADAAALVRPAEERLAEISGGRTAHDVARDGAASDEQAARAFVALRLAAAARTGGAPEALAASERILDAARVDRSDDDGPYRAHRAPMIAASPAPPLAQPTMLLPRRWYWFFATVLAWGVMAARACHWHRRCECGSYSEIAKTGAKKLAYESYPLWRQKHPDIPCPTLAQLAEVGGATKDPWGEEYRVRCYASPIVGDGILAWSKGEDRSDHPYGNIVSWELY